MTKQDIMTKKQAEELEMQVGQLRREREYLLEQQTDTTDTRLGRVQAAWLALLAFVGVCGFVVVTFFTIYASASMWDWTLELWK